MSNQSGDENTSKFHKVPSAESFLMNHGGVKSSHEECSSKILPPRMRQVMQQNTTKMLRKLRNQLKKFAKFVEGMQIQSQSKMQLFPGSSHPKAPKPTGSSNTRPVQQADTRPKSTPLKDAFQMVRNLIWRISVLIDQVAAEIPAEDDKHIDVQSPHFDYYYAQYVFQLIHFILQMVGEELEQFCKVLADFSVNDDLNNLPDKVDEIDVNVSGHKTFSKETDNFEASQSSSVTSSEGSSSASDGCLTNVDFKRQTREAVELLTVLSKSIMEYFHNKRLPEFSEEQQCQLSKRALSMKELCKNCSKKVLRRLRHYKSRENLFLEKYEASSDESLLSYDAHQKKQSRHAFFAENISGTHQSYIKSKTATISHINLGSVSPKSSDAEIEITYQKQKGPLKSPSHGEPLKSGQTKSVSVSKQVKGPNDDVIDNIITVTDDSGIHKKIDNIKKRDEINFNLQEFCTLLKEEFSNLLSKESKSGKGHSETSDSNLISNILIQCFRESSKGGEENIAECQESSKGGEENITHSSIRFDVPKHNSQSAKGESITTDSKPRKKELSLAVEDEKDFDEAVEKFVKDTYQIALSALKKNKSKGSPP